MSKGRITAISLILGALTTVAGLLIVNHEKIEKWRLSKNYWGDYYPVKNIYKDILLSPTAFIVFITTSLIFGIIIAMIDSSKHKDNKSDTKED